MQKTVLAAFCLVIATGALAQTSLNRSQEREAVGVITDVGGACERVVRTQTIGQIDDNTTLMAVACIGDENQYVLQLDNRGNMAFYATCANLATGTNNQIRCFSGTGARQRDGFAR